MKIALVQQHASPDPAENLARGMAAFCRAAEKGARLVAFAELAFLRFLPQQRASARRRSLAEIIPGPTTEAFAPLCRRYRTAAVLNLFERRGRRTYDASPVIDTDGRLLGVTRMMHIMDGPGFYERGYYAAGPARPLVHRTRLGRVGVAICYDRHFPEYMRAQGLQGAELVVVPQAGVKDEWGAGVFEAELQSAALQNGYYAALVNRVGREEVDHFAGESFVVDPFGLVTARAPRGRDFLLMAEVDFQKRKNCPATRHFLRDRRPDLYSKLGF
jgi:N-carbamoylputrescine amidase